MEVIKRSQLWVRIIWRHILDAIFPISCIHCSEGEELICESCNSRSAFLLQDVCHLCGEKDERGICASHRAETGIDYLRVCYSFHDPLVREKIHAFKYSFFEEVGRRMSGDMRRLWESEPITVDGIIPMPLHPKKEKERGFNQAVILAKELSDFASIDVMAAKRKKITATQAKLLPQERKENVCNAFEVTGYAGESLLLVDDVITTGSTLASLAFKLKEKGTKQIGVLCYAKGGV